jgi:hypothetical protein
MDKILTIFYVFCMDITGNILRGKLFLKARYVWRHWQIFELLVGRSVYSMTISYRTQNNVLSKLIFSFAAQLYLDLCFVVLNVMTAHDFLLR